MSCGEREEKKKKRNEDVVLLEAVHLYLWYFFFLLRKAIDPFSFFYCSRASLFFWLFSRLRKQTCGSFYYSIFCPFLLILKGTGMRLALFACKQQRQQITVLLRCHWALVGEWQKGMKCQDFERPFFFFEDRTNQMLRQVRTMKERFVDLNRVS